jgi:hypothetical protein
MVVEEEEEEEENMEMEAEVQDKGMSYWWTVRLYKLKQVAKHSPPSSTDELLDFINWNKSPSIPLPPPLVSSKVSPNSNYLFLSIILNIYVQCYCVHPLSSVRTMFMEENAVLAPSASEERKLTLNKASPSCL